MSILWTISDMEKGAWPSRSLQENRVEANPLPYENIIILLPSCKLQRGVTLLFNSNSKQKDHIERTMY